MESQVGPDYDSDVDIIGACLNASATGPFFPDWEFEYLFGLTRAEVARIAAAWPHVDWDEPTVALAVRNSLNNLLGYPHGMSERLSDSIVGGEAAIEAVLGRWETRGH